MRKFLYHLFILVGLFFSSLSYAQIVLEALEKPTGCSAIPSFHPFHKVTRGNYKMDGTFADPYTGEGSAYMKWITAVNYSFPAGYHLPTVAEWMTISPNNNVWNIGTNTTLLNQVENHQFGKKGEPTTQYKTFKGDYYRALDGTLYGIRFKPSDQTNGNFTPHTTSEYTTAYRYRMYSDRLIVDIKYIGYGAATIADVSAETFWETDECHDAYVFMHYGFYFAWGEKCVVAPSAFLDDYNYAGAWYWLADGVESCAGTWWVHEYTKASYVSDGQDYYDTIRLFKD